MTHPNTLPRQHSLADKPTGSPYRHPPHAASPKKLRSHSRWRQSWAHLLAGLAICLFAPSGFAAVCYVNQAAGSNGDGSSWSHAYNDLQSALTFPGNLTCDEVWVAKGTYKPTPFSERDKTFSIRSGQALYGGFSGTETSRSQRNADPASNGTVLSGGIDPGTVNRSYHVVFIATSDASTVLDGFTISHGRAETSGTHGIFPGGGGLYCEGSTTTECSPTLRNLIFANNHGNFGGGMLTYGKSSPKLSNVVFRSNQASHDGGAIFTYLRHATGSPEFENVRFEQNKAPNGNGGALYARVLWDGDGKNSTYLPSFRDVTFNGNEAAEQGGAIRVEYNGFSSATAKFSGATFNNNSAKYGGAIYLDLGSGGLHLTNTTFHNNSASSYGGALNIRISLGTSKIRHTTFQGNHAPLGSAIYFAWFDENTVQNSIFWGNTGSPPIAVGHILDARDSIIQDGCPGNADCTNISTADPQLGALQANGGSTWTMLPDPESPAINAGTDLSVATDQRGVSRPQGGTTPDLGAVELRQYTVNTHVDGGNGSISPMAIKVPENGMTSFSIFPDTGYYVTSATGCGGSYDEVEGKFYTGPVTGDCTVTVKFGADLPTLFTAKAVVVGGDALITPQPLQLVVPGGTASWTVYPVIPYLISSVSGCDGTLVGNTFTTVPLYSGCTATFNLKTPKIFSDGFE